MIMNMIPPVPAAAQVANVTLPARLADYPE
jgi:hypothetical protein